MDSERSDRPERVRLPGFDERPAPRPGPYSYTSPADPTWRPAHARDDGVRYTRRVSNWTAAALIAAVAATTGYLAHSIPATGASSGPGTGAHSKSPGVAPAGPAVGAPVVTTGGSGAASAGRDN